MTGTGRLRKIASPRGRRLSIRMNSRPSRSRRKRRTSRPSASVTVMISSPARPGEDRVHAVAAPFAAPFLEPEQALVLVMAHESLPALAHDLAVIRLLDNGPATFRMLAPLGVPGILDVHKGWRARHGWPYDRLEGLLTLDSGPDPAGPRVSPPSSGPAVPGLDLDPGLAPTGPPGITTFWPCCPWPWPCP